MTDRARAPSAKLSKAAPLAALALLTSGPAEAQAQAQISALSDITIGTIGTLSADIMRTETVCAYSSGTLLRYTIKATGNGPGFTLKSTLGGALPYEVQWNQAANASSGTALASGTALSGLTAQTLVANCALGASGTLIVILRAAELTAASAGDYSGALTLLLSPN